MSPYMIKDTDLFLDMAPRERPYILKLRDLPQEKKPREKLLKFGASALTSPELLAVIIGTGTKKEGVLEMSARVLREYGERSLAGEVNPATLSRELNIPLIKALQIAACAELGRRFFKRGSGSAATIRTAKDVFNYFQDMRGLSKEQLRGIYLNSHHKIIHDETISIGTIDANMVHPREVFRPALEYSAVAVVLAHNHASGNPMPSDADIIVTEQLVAAGKIMGIALLDHVIITKNSFISIPIAYE